MGCTYSHYIMRRLTTARKRSRGDTSELKVVPIGNSRAGWDDTFKEMALEREDWGDLDAALSDGLDTEPW